MAKNDWDFYIIDDRPDYDFAIYAKLRRYYFENKHSYNTKLYLAFKLERSRTSKIPEDGHYVSFKFVKRYAKMYYQDPDMKDNLIHVDIDKLTSLIGFNTLLKPGRTIKYFVFELDFNLIDNNNYLSFLNHCRLKNDITLPFLNQALLITQKGNFPFVINDGIMEFVDPLDLDYSYSGFRYTFKPDLISSYDAAYMHMKYHIERFKEQDYQSLEILRLYRLLATTITIGDLINLTDTNFLLINFYRKGNKIHQVQVSCEEDFYKVFDTKIKHDMACIDLDLFYERIVNHLRKSHFPMKQRYNCFPREIENNYKQLPFFKDRILHKCYIDK